MYGQLAGLVFKQFQYLLSLIHNSTCIFTWFISRSVSCWKNTTRLVYSPEI